MSARDPREFSSVQLVRKEFSSVRNFHCEGFQFGRSSVRNFTAEFSSVRNFHCEGFQFGRSSVRNFTAEFSSVRNFHCGGSVRKVLQFGISLRSFLQFGISLASVRNFILQFGIFVSEFFSSEFSLRRVLQFGIFTAEGSSVRNFVSDPKIARNCPSRLPYKSAES